MKIYSSSKLNVAIFLMLYFVSTHSRDLTGPSLNQPSPPVQNLTEPSLNQPSPPVQNLTEPSLNQSSPLVQNLTGPSLHQPSPAVQNLTGPALNRSSPPVQVLKDQPVPLQAVAVERPIAEGECNSNYYTFTRCYIPNATPGMTLRVVLIWERLFSRCGQGNYGLSDDNSYMWTFRGCSGYFEIREIGEVPEESGEVHEESGEVHEESGEDTNTRRPAYPLTCGRRGSSDEGYRIIGGTESGECELPWMVYVFRQEWDLMYTCGGSILDRSHILTAAHCVTNDDGSLMSSETFTILSGTSYISPPEALIDGSAVKSYVSEIYRHPYYSRWPLDNDIAIIKLKQPLDWDSCHSPICLPDGETAPRNGGDCIVAGWGTTSNFDDTTSRSLMWTDTEVVSCGIYFPSTRNGFCADGHNHGACSGDSGGPLACRRSDSEGYIQYGITSAGIQYNCGRKPGIYTDVNKFIPWINGIIGN